MPWLQPRARLTLAAAVLSLGLGSCAASPTGLDGSWDGVVVVNAVEIPFTFELNEEGGALSAAFFDGDLRVPSTSGVREGDRLTVAFAQYGTRLVASVVDGRLEGRYERGTRGAAYAFRATRATASVRSADAAVPAIAGDWIIPHESSKGERAWRLVVQQDGSTVSAAILRVDGDTGALTGSFRDGTFILSHFSGARPMLLEATLTPDGSLSLLQNRQTNLVAYRATDARAQAAPAPTDPLGHTRVRDPNAVFTFRFPDLHGRMVSQADFAGKVLVVNMTGSWCPNCHDEAPFLTALDRQYRDQGLAVVAFAFEEADQLKNPERLQAFIRRFAITYPVLLAGVPEDLAEKVPQAENLNAFPTTIFVGRDGRIRAIHAGFASRATGAFHTKGQEEITAIVTALLAEPQTRPE